MDTGIMEYLEIIDTIWKTAEDQCDLNEVCGCQFQVVEYSQFHTP